MTPAEIIELARQAFEWESVDLTDRYLRYLPPAGGERLCSVSVRPRARGTERPIVALAVLDGERVIRVLNFEQWVAA